MVARALAQEPLLLLLDEPTAFLDVPSRVELMGLLQRLTRNASLAAVMSTHDLELALHTADVLWLLMPGGQLAIGAPEDVIASGDLSRAFEGRRVHFDVETRTFRWATGERGRASVQGAGLRAGMARAVLEREGFEVTAGGGCDVAVSIDERRWRVSAYGAVVEGVTFRELAAHLRGLAAGGTNAARVF